MQMSRFTKYNKLDHFKYVKNICFALLRPSLTNPNCKFVKYGTIKLGHFIEISNVFAQIKMTHLRKFRIK